MTYNEDALIEQPAIKLFADLAWDTLNCWEEIFGEASLLGRENRGDVVLVNRLRNALVKLNPISPELAIEKTMDALTRDRSVMSDTAANEQIYLLLKEGYKFVTPDEDEDDVAVKVIVGRDLGLMNNCCISEAILGDVEI